MRPLDSVSVSVLFVSCRCLSPSERADEVNSEEPFFQSPAINKPPPLPTSEEDEEEKEEEEELVSREHHCYTHTLFTITKLTSS